MFGLCACKIHLNTLNATLGSRVISSEHKELNLTEK